MLSHYLVNNKKHGTIPTYLRKEWSCMAEIKAVMFDLYETLITEWGGSKYTDNMRLVDLDVDSEAYRAVWDTLHAQRFTGELTFEQALIYCFNAIGEKPDMQKIDFVMEKRIRSKAECFKAINKNVISLLEELKKHGYLIGMISNCSEDEVIALSDSELYSFFDTVVLSYEVGICKPNKAIFDICCQRLNVKAEECLYVGDGGSNELPASTSVGMRAVQAKWFSLDKDRKDADSQFSQIYNPLEILNII